MEGMPVSQGPPCVVRSQNGGEPLKGLERHLRGVCGAKDALTEDFEYSISLFSPHPTPLGRA